MKRQDLQGIRGVAILLVLAFHLHPTRFPLGFVGVDIFFVLSGFLMALILSGNKKAASCQIFTSFYSRRFRRIVPVYHVCLLAVFTGCAYLLLPSDKEQLLVDLKWSLAFLSNIEPFYEVKGYWDQVTSYRFLVHCWSLAVEIQFYLLAPFLITATNRCSPFLRLFTLSILALLSAVFQLITPTNISYDLLPSRIWQFLLGILCYKAKEPETSQEDAIEKEKLLEDTANESLTSLPPPYSSPTPKWTNFLSEAALILLVVVILVNPPFLTKEIIRVISCLIATFTIRCPVPPGSLLSSRPLAFIGDLSYTMYLVHWPIIVAAKYYYNLNVLSFTETLALLVGIFMVTIAVHYIVEKPLISGGILRGITVSLVCIALISALGPRYKDCCLKIDGKTKIINITEAIEFNLRESNKIYYQIPCDPDTVTPLWTNWTAEPELRCQTYSNGTLKILIMGNSIAYRAFPLVKEVLNGRYNELRLFSRSSTPPLSDKNPHITAAAHIVVDKMRPDIIWNIHCEYDDVFIRPFLNKSTDEAFLAFQKNLDFYTSRTKAFIIDLPYYWSNVRVCYELVRYLQLGLPLDSLKISKEEAIQQQKYHQARLLALNCTKCSYNKVEDLLFDGDTYWFYNRENYHGYTKEGQHFTPEFLEKLKPLYKKKVDEILSKFER